MKFDIGSVIRLDYKWPHDARKDDGQKSRPCVVFQDQDGAYFVSPMTTSPPDKDTAEYAIPITSRLQRQLGLGDSKPSWVYANHANLVELPNPALRKAQAESWIHGRAPGGLLDAMKVARNRAIADQAMKLARIPRDVSAERYRSAAAIPRALPGARKDDPSRQRIITEKALERVARESASAESRKMRGVSRDGPSRH